MVPAHRKVVARYLDGRLVKGYTFDFSPAQPRFHIFPEPSASGASAQVFLRELKALFFVRDLAGDPARHDRLAPPPGETSRGLMEVRFRDGELMVGTVEGEPSDSPGFFLVPADAGSNNLRVYVLAAATRSVYALPALVAPRPRPARAAVTAPPPARREDRPLLPARLLAWLAR
jgi:hypothetical protein